MARYEYRPAAATPSGSTRTALSHVRIALRTARTPRQAVRDTGFESMRIRTAPLWRGVTRDRDVRYSRRPKAMMTWKDGAGT